MRSLTCNHRAITHICHVSTVRRGPPIVVGVQYPSLATMRILRSSARRFFLGGISFAAYELCLSPDGENFRSHAKQLWNNFSVGETVKVWDAEHLVQKVEAAWDAKLIQLLILTIAFKVMAVVFKRRVERDELLEGKATPAPAAAASTRAAKKKRS